MGEVPIKLVIVDGALPHQLNAVHGFVASNADGWWHHIPTVWILGSAQDATWWRDQLMPLVSSAVVGSAPPTLMVFDLPAAGARGWGYYGPDDANQIGWLNENYS